MNKWGVLISSNRTMEKTEEIAFVRLTLSSFEQEIVFGYETEHYATKFVRRTSSHCPRGMISSRSLVVSLMIRLE